MIKSWFISVIWAALGKEISEIISKQDFVEVKVDAALQGIEQLATKLGEIQRANSELHAQSSNPAHDGSAASQPVSTSRPSWPRMKRYLEERDVRNLVAEQQASGDFRDASRIASKMSDEAERLEAYWRHKSARNEAE